MMMPGAVYQPADITLMRSTLDDAVAELPPYCQTSSYKAALAERNPSACRRWRTRPDETQERYWM